MLNALWNVCFFCSIDWRQFHLKRHALIDTFQIESEIYIKCIVKRRSIRQFIGTRLNMIFRILFQAWVNNEHCFAWTWYACIWMLIEQININFKREFSRMTDQTKKQVLSHFITKCKVLNFFFFHSLSYF